MRIAGIYAQKMEIDTKRQHMYGQPTGLLQVLGTIEGKGHVTQLFCPIELNDKGEFINSDDGSFLERVFDFQPDVIAFSIMTAQFPYSKYIAERIKAFLPSVIIIAGGRHPTFDAQNLESPFDVYIIGEGEQTAIDLLHAISHKKDLCTVQGIVFRDGDSNIIKTEKRARIKDLDTNSIMKIDSELMKLVYSGISFPALKKKPRYALLEYSRGCSGVCEFCDTPNVLGYPEYRSASATADYIEYCMSEFNTEIFYVIDLNFTANHKRAFELCNEIVKRNLSPSWYCMSNITTAKRDLLQAMKEAGCFKVCYGVESASNASLAKMNKSNGTDKSLLQIEKAQEVLKMSYDCGIINNMYYIIGFPWETEEMILDGQALFNQYCGLQVNIGIFTPHYGTKLRRNMAENFVFSNDLAKYDRGALCYNHPYISPERMIELQVKLYNEFYSCDEYAARLGLFLSKSPKYIDSFFDYFEYNDFRIKEKRELIFA